LIEQYPGVERCTLTKTGDWSSLGRHRFLDTKNSSGVNGVDVGVNISVSIAVVVAVMVNVGVFVTVQVFVAIAVFVGVEVGVKV
jgi:hypothetical protein